MSDDAHTSRITTQVSQCGSVSIWLRKLPEADQQAQNEILRKYRDRLVGYAAWRLRQLGVRAKDADDIAQEVFLGLFQRAAAGKMPDLKRRSDLWLKLRRIAGDRVKDARKKKLPFTESAVQPAKQDQSDQAGLGDLADPQLDECMEMVEHELIRRHLQQRHEDLPEIAALRMQGYRPSEIAEQLDQPKRTIERRLQWIDELCAEYAQE